MLVTGVGVVRRASDSWLQPSIYQGRWVRIEARDPAGPRTPARAAAGVVRYTVSDGTQRTTGQVDVLQQGPLDDSVPLVAGRHARPCARATPCRCRCSTTTRWPTASRCRSTRRSVKVVSKGDAQRAFASGNVIRYVPEARGPARRAVRHHRVRRLRRRDEGPRPDRARAGRRSRRCRRRQRVNQSPVARSFSATVTAGDPLTMTVPTFGVDPDGDSVSVHRHRRGRRRRRSTSPTAGSSPSGRRRSATRRSRWPRAPR